MGKALPHPGRAVVQDHQPLPAIDRAQGGQGQGHQLPLLLLRPLRPQGEAADEQLPQGLQRPAVRHRQRVAEKDGPVVGKGDLPHALGHHAAQLCLFRRPANVL